MVFATWKRGGVFALRGGLGMIVARSIAQVNQFVQTMEAVVIRILEGMCVLGIYIHSCVCSYGDDFMFRVNAPFANYTTLCCSRIGD